jgi:DNA mismatch repair protein MutL
MRIKVLPDSVINQIAAGEVVERPASVVRELVDNAVDAGATDIFVALEGGGQSRLKVRDNGHGMAKDEAILAFERHATSKVSSVDDLTNLGTLGFRGEALASIAAVSKVQLRTRVQDCHIGTQVTFRGGKLTDVQSVAWSEGTEIEVEHLFFNTPARRKFLKSPRSEVARIRSWIVNSSLAHPEVRYQVVSDGDEIVHLHPVRTIAERARSVFGSELIPIQLSEGGVSVEGMVGHPGQALSDASGFVILVNRRLISDKLVIRAVREGYDSMLKDREFPVGYISITLPGEYVDVNVHPQKSEVRFRHTDQIFAVVRGAVLSGVRSIKRPMLTVMNEAASESPSNRNAVVIARASAPSEAATVIGVNSASIVYEAQPLFGASSQASVASSVGGRAGTVREPLAAYGAKPQSVRFRFSDLRYIGQALECYLLCEYQEYLVVIDMHAAHERVNYNRIRKARSERELTTQKLLLPETVRLTAEQVVHLTEQLDVLAALGFEIQQVSDDAVEVHGVPGAVSHLNCTALLKECAAEPLSIDWRERLEERIDHMAARVACHASVRSGDLLTKQEAYALCEQLDETDLAGACPH